MSNPGKVAVSREPMGPPPPRGKDPIRRAGTGEPPTERNLPRDSQPPGEGVRSRASDDGSEHRGSVKSERQGSNAGDSASEAGSTATMDTTNSTGTLASGASTAFFSQQVSLPIFQYTIPARLLLLLLLLAKIATTPPALGVRFTFSLSTSLRGTRSRPSSRMASTNW